MKPLLLAGIAVVSLATAQAETLPLPPRPLRNLQNTILAPLDGKNGPAACKDIFATMGAIEASAGVKAWYDAHHLSIRLLFADDLNHYRADVQKHSPNSHSFIDWQNCANDPTVIATFTMTPEDRTRLGY